MLDKAGLELVRQSYKAARPKYAALSVEVASRLLDEARRRGIQCSCSGRAKEVDSFVKKAFSEKYEDPLSQIRDKAGARLLLTYKDDLDDAKAMVEGIFEVRDTTDKATLAARTVGVFDYHGYHFEVVLPGDVILQTESGSHEVTGLVCEVQIQSRAQNLWNDISHAYFYKTLLTVPNPSKHAIHRLEALMEIFDEELVRVRDDVMSQPGAESARILLHLERLFYHLTSRPYSERLSIEVVDLLSKTLSREEKETLDDDLDVFVRENEEKLEEVYQTNLNVDDTNPLLFQPESILVFQRLEQDPFGLRDAWETEFPVEILEDLAIQWGVRV